LRECHISALYVFGREVTPLLVQLSIAKHSIILNPMQHKEPAINKVVKPTECGGKLVATNLDVRYQLKKYEVWFNSSSEQPVDTEHTLYPDVGMSLHHVVYYSRFTCSSAWRNGR